MRPRRPACRGARWFALATAVGVAILLRGGAGPALAEGPVFRNPHNFDSKYALDLLSNELPLDWRAAFAKADTGMQIGGGSLNIRHLALTEHLKLRMPLAGDWLAFRFQRERRAGLEREDEWNLLEFEARVHGPWHVGILGNPSFHKADASFGVAGAWRGRPGRWARLSVLWPQFDTNYAFQNTSVNEGYSKAYRHFPRETRLEASWWDHATDVVLDARHGRPWELDEQTFTPAPDRFIETGEMDEARLDVRRRAGPWTGGVQAAYWRAEGSILYDPARPAEDRRVRWEHRRVFFTLDRAWGNGHTWRAGAGPSWMSGRADYPLDPSLRDGYNFQDTMALLGVSPRLSPAFRGEAAWMWDRQKSQVVKGPTPIDRDRRLNRLKFSLRGDSGSASLVIAANIELNASNADPFFTFDGGIIQFQATFP